MAHETVAFQLPVPEHFDPDRVAEIRPVPYQQRADEARAWARIHDIAPSGADALRVSLLLVDVQNTFCIPGFELFVGGRSGTGAVDDNRRLCRFIYRNLHRLTEIAPTLDSHQALQIFHALFLVDAQGGHPAPFTLVTADDIAEGRWRFNADLAPALGVSAQYGQAYLEHYARTLASGGKYDLTVWPYHAMMGGIGHALVPAVEEAIFFHSAARLARVDFQIKGDHPLTENYSALRPEVLTGPGGEEMARKNSELLEKLLAFDAVIVAGQAKSHCVGFTLSDLLDEMTARHAGLAEKIYLLEDCTSPVVIPGVIDYTESADAAFARFADAGMHRVRSTDPMDRWPGIFSNG